MWIIRIDVNTFVWIPWHVYHLILSKDNLAYIYARKFPYLFMLL